MEKGIPARLSVAEGRRFGLLVGGVFLALAAVSHWRGHGTAPWVLGSIGGSLAAGGLLFPRHLGWIYRAWMRLALLISRVTTPIFMGVVYFFILTPTGLLLRAFGKNPLHHRAGGGTLWVSRKKDAEVERSMARQF